MMTRYFSKVGVWIFIFAVAWYLAGNYFLDRLKKEQVAYAESMHVKEQHADIGSNSRAVIRALGDDFRVSHIKLVFDPAASQASINNEDMQVAASTQFVDGVFNITFSKAVAPMDHHKKMITEIRLPSSVNKVEIAGIDAVEISGSLPAPAAELVLENLGCTAKINIEQLQVNRLKLVASCQIPPKNECCSTQFNLSEQIQIGKLEVVMQHGSLDYSGSKVPQETLLNVGDNVSITGRREFLQSLRFGNGSR
ncbi:hypothetical protein ACO0LD_18115 [Undibacterium sp. Ji83W]|uniref:hypothetical protein n=1 Tax=Undibacterium sp. Ji83W TaxID=3413043 RepID=UPI003BF444B2